MANVTHRYGRWSKEMLAELRRSGGFKVEAFVAWLMQRGVHVDRTLVSHGCAGRSHMPADVLPLLAEFSGRPEGVFSPYLQAVGCDVFRLPCGKVADDDLVDLVLDAGASLGRLQQALCDARAPDSPGGASITREERSLLVRRLDTLLRQLADLRVRLAVPG